MTDKRTTIPLRYELAYMMDQRRLIHDLALVAIDTLSRRTDALEDDLAKLLGLSADALLNRATLRRKLRAIALGVEREKMQELSRILGKRLRRPSLRRIERWIEEQEKAIRGTILEFVSRIIDAWAGVERRRELSIPELVWEVAGVISGMRQRSASAAVLALNSEIIREVAQGGGATHYRWISQRDSRVRDWHAKLDKPGAVYSWAKPPMGGGTTAEDKGHPGSGWGCRCRSELIV